MKGSLVLVKEFLHLMGYEWKYSFWKHGEETFSTAQTFLDIETNKRDSVVLELYQGNRVWYLWFRINEDTFQKILSKGCCVGEECVEDYSEDWNSFVNNNVVNDI